MSSGALVLSLAAATSVAWLGLEAYLKMTGRPLVTDKVREWNEFTHGLVGALFGLVTGGLMGHFFWCGG